MTRAAMKQDEFLRVKQDIGRITLINDSLNNYN